MNIIQKLSETDKALFFWINKSLSNPFFDVLMPLITNPDNWIIPGSLLILCLLIFGEKRGRITVLVLLVVIGLTDSIAAQIIKPWIGRIRPSHTYADMINLLVSKGGKYSFVSNHAANMFALTVVVSYFYRSWKPWLVSISILIAFSRIYVGVHYPGDVIAGALFGYGIAWTVITLFVILKMRELKRGRTWVWYDDSPHPTVP